MFFQFCVRFSLPRSHYTWLLLHSTKRLPDLDFLSRQRLVIDSKLSMTNGTTGNSGHSFQDNAPFSIHDQFDQANCGLKMQEIAPFCLIFLKNFRGGMPLEPPRDACDCVARQPTAFPSKRVGRYVCGR